MTEPKPQTTNDKLAYDLATDIVHHFGYEHEDWINEIYPMIKNALDDVRKQAYESGRNSPA